MKLYSILIIIVLKLLQPTFLVVCILYFDENVFILKVESFYWRNGEKLLNKLLLISHYTFLKNEI